MVELVSCHILLRQFEMNHDQSQNENGGERSECHYIDIILHRIILNMNYTLCYSKVLLMMNIIDCTLTNAQAASIKRM